MYYKSGVVYYYNFTIIWEGYSHSVYTVLAYTQDWCRSLHWFSQCFYNYENTLSAIMLIMLSSRYLAKNLLLICMTSQPADTRAAGSPCWATGSRDLIPCKNIKISESLIKFQSSGKINRTNYRRFQALCCLFHACHW